MVFLFEKPREKVYNIIKVKEGQQILIGEGSMEYKDYYKILEVEKSSSQDEIKKSYRRLAKKYHPDLHPDDTVAHEKFKEINEAYEVLGDEEKKKKYDMFGSNYNFAGGQDFDPSQYGFGGNTYTYSSGDGGDFSDFFNMFFGGGSGGFDINDLFSGGRGSTRGPAPRQSYESQLNISIEDGYKGGEKDVSISLGGSRQNISVKIPKGITPGKKIRVRGEKWGIDGDILFKINFIEDEKLRLEGLDLIKRVDILPWEAALGDKILLSTLEGKIRVTIPKAIEGGKKLRIAKKGYRDMKGKQGDLYIQINIVNPPNLTKKEEKLYKELKELNSYELDR